MKICTIAGCTKKVNARGYCPTHYGMWLKHGDPLYADKKLHLPSLGARPNTLKDFWAKVDKRGRCWTWLGAKDLDGYGFFWFRNKQLRAHRFVAEYVLKLYITDLQVCHKCDNPSCVRPSHLFVGTVKDNAVDRDNKGRGVRGRKQMDRVGLKD